jgi:glycosyltransferase involved in cell wall biosynthesis
VFHVVGGGGDVLARWRSRLADSPNVTLHGYVPYAQTQAYLAAFDVVVAPYQDFVQGQGGGASNLADWMSPLKLFEYMSRGKAIVCSDLPVIREVLTDGVNALLVPHDDPAAWSAALKTLRDDPDQRRRLAETARADFERAYSLESRAGRIIDALRAPVRGT